MNRPAGMEKSETVVKVDNTPPRKPDDRRNARVGSIASKNRDEVLKPSTVAEFITILETGKISNHQSLLPETQNMPGGYDFNISFNAKQEAARYSEKENKLRVSKDAPVSVGFRTTTAPLSAELRIMLMYTDPKHSNRDVQRCSTHALEDFGKRIEAPDHVLHVEHGPASYVRNSGTLRRSVIVPYHSQKAYPTDCNHVFKFRCSSSCVGGMNGRAVQAIFTLEEGGVVVGRQTVNVEVSSLPHIGVGEAFEKVAKIPEVPAVCKPSVHCPSSWTPGRPFRSVSPPKPKRSTETSETSEKQDLSGHEQNIAIMLNWVNTTSLETTSPPGPPYVVEIKDRTEYVFLQKVLDWYHSRGRDASPEEN